VAHALLIDCEAETYEHVPLPDGLVVLLIDSGVARNLDDVGYAERVEQCNEAAKILGVGSLRHADPDILRERDSDLDPLILRRARHVVSENERVTRAAAALRDGNLPEVGELFAASHRSLAQDFEVSTPELDLLVSLASEMQGVVGARLTGAGFGGCTVNLVEAAAAERTAEHVCDRYRAATGRPTRWWISKPAEGASLSLA
jgi:galactokinase